jgi:hypothetical protein
VAGSPSWQVLFYSISKNDGYELMITQVRFRIKFTDSLSYLYMLLLSTVKFSLKKKATYILMKSKVK